MSSPRVGLPEVRPLVPRGFGAVTRFYEDFPQTCDAEVVSLLASA